MRAELAELAELKRAEVGGRWLKASVLSLRYTCRVSVLEPET
jgi:hypothetical protein